jgi:hypothetical protein
MTDVRLIESYVDVLAGSATAPAALIESYVDVLLTPSTGVDLDAETATVTVSAPAPTLAIASTAITLAAPAATVTVSAPAPTLSISAGGSITLAAPAATVAVSAPAPTLSISGALTSWTSDLSQQAVADFTSPAAILYVAPPAAAAPATIVERTILRNSIMLDPMTVDTDTGRVDPASFDATVTGEVGVYHVTVDGVDVTYWRDAPTVIGQMHFSEPGGEDSATASAPPSSRPGMCKATSGKATPSSTGCPPFSTAPTSALSSPNT